MSWPTPSRRRGAGVWLAAVLAGVVGLASTWGGAGASWAQTGGGGRAACPEGDVPAAGFADVGGNPHRHAINCVVWYGLAKGVGSGRYAPRQPVRRDQLATFVIRLLDTAGVDIPQPRDQGFEDLGGNVHARHINQLAALGIVQGLRPHVYAPGRAVRRDQMASFLVRAYERLAATQLPAPPSGFQDTAGNPHEPNIDKAAAAGFAQGLTPTTYHPGGRVRRDQMASFLARVLARGVAAGHVTPRDPDPTTDGSGGGMLGSDESLLGSGVLGGSDEGASQSPAPQAPEQNPPAASPAAFSATEDYMAMLQRWPSYAEQGFTTGHRGHAGMGYFGSGHAVEQGMRALGNFIFVYALLAVDERYDPTVSGVPRSRLEAHARKALHYMTRTHVTGDVAASDGRQWGDQWQSSWWAARMAGGAQLLWERLNPHERGQVRRVVIHEANRLARRDPPSRREGDSVAEENAWNTEVLAWALALFPHDEQAPRWRTALNRWAMNSLSVAADAASQRAVEGRTVAEWNETVNVHDDFTIDNHGGYHAGYMAWPLQSLTWSYYALASTGRPVPATLLHHYRDVWRRLRATYLGDGRFPYLGGKDWPRYAYGLYAVVPPAVLMQYRHGDRVAASVEAARLQTLAQEQRRWGDGGFFSGRFTGGTAGWSAEYESDTAAILGMAYRLSGILERDGSAPAPLGGGELASTLAGSYHSPHGQFVTARAGGFFTAFSWDTLDCCAGAGGQPHQVLGLVSPDDAHMVEWAQGQLAGTFSLRGVGAAQHGVRWHRTRTLSAGGYATLGERWFGGSPQQPRLTQQLAMVSLPQADRALILDSARAREPTEVTSSQALSLFIPNDIFNGSERRLRAAGRQLTVSGPVNTRVTLPGSWVNVDGRLGIAYRGTAGALELDSSSHRNRPWNSLRADTLRWRPSRPAGVRSPGEGVRELLFAFHRGGAAETQQLAGGMGLLPTGTPKVEAAWVGMPGGGATVVIANFTARPRTVALDLQDVPGRQQAALQHRVPSQSVEVLRPH